MLTVVEKAFEIYNFCLREDIIRFVVLSINHVTGGIRVHSRMELLHTYELIRHDQSHTQLREMERVGGGHSRLCGR